MNGPTDGVVGGAAAPFLTGFKPVRAAMNRETAAAEIVRQLLQWVSENATESGQRLPSERQPAEIFGVGRSTVREATKALTFLGLIDVRQGAGTYLRSTESGMLPNVIEWGLVLPGAHPRPG